MNEQIRELLTEQLKKEKNKNNKLMKLLHKKTKWIKMKVGTSTFINLLVLKNDILNNIIAKYVFNKSVFNKSACPGRNKQ